jgi:hypothetical protein
MKLKKNCMFFNAKVEGSATVDWGHELGQSRDQGFIMTVDGCSEVINGLVYNQVKDNTDFEYGRGGENDNKEIEIISIFSNVKVRVYDVDEGVHHMHTISNPFILIITKETSTTSHPGRRTLKMNIGFSCNDIENKNFYEEVNTITSNPWFGYDLSYDNINTGVLTLTIIKAPQPEPIEGKPDLAYRTSTERKDIWNRLVIDYSEKERSKKTDNPLAKNKIFYGAPGTGKSHKVNELLRSHKGKTQRVTFHPEYDYASFVGGYKPTMHGDDIRYEFVPQAFTNIYLKAWGDLENEYYLVIEEINRGNCAEIFGDIFQLLDRTNSYPIVPSKELKEYIETKSYDNDTMPISEMILPPNLNILATMNTSDQSLFPMDSAFKRRWDWEYIPINYDISEINLSSKYSVKLSEHETFSWLSFIKEVNNVIRENENLGMDKCIGNYFIKPLDEIIELDTFINKAVYYLWNDVFKDELEEDSIFQDHSAYEDFFPIPSNGITKVREILNFLKVDIINQTEA